LLFIAPLIKHKAYEDESEWRIIIRVNRDKVEMRQGNTAFVPYHALKIEKKSVNGITFGPCENADYVKQSVDFLCYQYFKNIKMPNVVKSNVPFR